MNKHFIQDKDTDLSKYFKDIRNTNLLTADEEVELAIKIKNGDQKAIDKIVKSNLKFVIKIAKEYQGRGLSLADLINEGNYGLIKATTKFDHTRGFKFISYAVWWIRHAITQSLNDNSRTIRLPSNVINKMGTLRKEDNYEYLEAIASLPICNSLNMIINDEYDELGDVIKHPDSLEDVDFYEINSNIKKQLNNTLSILDDRERQIIEYYYGLNEDLEPMTLEDIGEIFGLTKERVRQIKSNTIRKLRYNVTNIFDALNE